MNKFDLINKVLVSDLDAKDKPLLIELIMRADDEWKCWPSIERLCKARGIKHERNFKGVDVYLPGLVTKVKRGRSYTYHINTSAVAELLDAEVTIKHTPPLSTSTPDTSAVEEVNTSAVAVNTSAVEGANSTYNNTSDSTEAPVVPSASPNYLSTETVYIIDTAGVTKTVQDRDTSAVEEVSKVKRILTPGEKKDFERAMRLHKATREQSAEALRIIQTTGGSQSIYEAATAALVTAGVALEEVEVW